MNQTTVSTASTASHSTAHTAQSQARKKAAANNKAAPDNTARTQAVASSETKRNMMLRLLAAQLVHQNPLKPIEPAQMSRQIGAIASLKQQELTNQLLKTLIVTAQSIAENTAGSHGSKK